MKILVSNFNLMKNRLAFTLMELMIVTIIVGIIGAFAIPNYQKAVEKAHERSAILNLNTIVATNEAFKARYGEYWPEYSGLSGNQGVASINAALKLNIIGSDVSYICLHHNDGTYSCLAFRGSPEWWLYVNSANQTPCCHPTRSLAPCPTVANCGYVPLF